MARLVGCPSCSLHILPYETRCPHCGAEQRSTSAPIASSILIGLALTGCPAGDDTDTGATTDPTTTTVSTDPTSTSQTSDPTTTTSSTTDDSLSGSGDVEYGSPETFDTTFDPTDDTTSTGGTGTGSTGTDGTGDSGGSGSDSVGEPEYGVPETN